jgi:hypothetical protein
LNVKLEFVRGMSGSHQRVKTSEATCQQDFEPVLNENHQLYVARSPKTCSSWVPSSMYNHHPTELTRICTYRRFAAPIACFWKQPQCIASPRSWPLTNLAPKSGMSGRRADGRGGWISRPRRTKPPPTDLLQGHFSIGKSTRGLGVGYTNSKHVES